VDFNNLSGATPSLRRSRQTLLFIVITAIATALFWGPQFLEQWRLTVESIERLVLGGHKTSAGDRRGASLPVTPPVLELPTAAIPSQGSRTEKPFSSPGGGSSQSSETAVVIAVPPRPRIRADMTRLGNRILPLRMQPDPTSRMLGSIAPNATCDLTGKTHMYRRGEQSYEEWLQVICDGRTGWVRGLFTSRIYE
jgi:hypothetical protein